MAERYRVLPAGSAKEILRRYAQEATSKSGKMKILACAARINLMLADDPLECGEPLYNLPNSGFQVRLLALSPLSVTFYVHEDEKVVFINKYTLLS